MIKVNVTRAASPFRRMRRKFIKVTAEAVLHMIFGKNYDSTDLTVTFVTMKTHPFKKLDPRTLGFANAKSRNHVIIHLNHQQLITAQQLVSTIAHELAHAKQYHLGDLKLIFNTIFFRGVQYPMVKIKKHGLNWEIRPWEMEAVELEERYVSKLDIDVLMERTLAK